MKEVCKDTYYETVEELAVYDSPESNKLKIVQDSRTSSSPKVNGYNRVTGTQDDEVALFLRIETVKTELALEITRVLFKCPIDTEPGGIDKDFKRLYRLICAYKKKHFRKSSPEDFLNRMKTNPVFLSETVSRIILKIKRLDNLIKEVNENSINLQRITGASFRKNRDIYLKMKVSKRSAFLISRTLGTSADYIINMVDIVIQGKKKIQTKLKIFRINKRELKQMLHKIDKYEKMIFELRNKLLCANRRLVFSIARNYTSKGVLFDDLLQEGYIGLIKAIEKFDIHKGYTLGSYASWWIRQAIQRSIAKQGQTIRYPENLLRDITFIKRENNIVSQIIEGPPAEDMLISEMGWDEGRYRFALDKSKQYIFTEFHADDNGKSQAVLDNIADPLLVSDISFNRTEHNMLEEDVLDILENVSTREAQILRLRFGLGGIGTHTLEEIGLEFNLTRERIRLIILNAIRKLKRCPQVNRLRIHAES